MTPGELGWFGIGPKSGRYDGLQFDELEYLLCKSLAYNAPISLQTGFSRLESHPLTPDLLEMIRIYERLRLAGTVSADTRQRLQRLGRDFVLLPETLREQGQPAEFVEVERAQSAAGGEEVRAFVGAWRGGSIATVWHYLGKEGQLSLDVPRVDAFDIRGQAVTIAEKDGQQVVPLDRRRLLLHFPGLEPATVQKRLAAARLDVRQPAVIYLQVEDPDYRPRDEAARAALAAGPLPE